MKQLKNWGIGILIVAIVLTAIFSGSADKKKKADEPKKDETPAQTASPAMQVAPQPQVAPQDTTPKKEKTSLAQDGLAEAEKEAERGTDIGFRAAFNHPAEIAKKAESKKRKLEQQAVFTETTAQKKQAEIQKNKYDLESAKRAKLEAEEEIEAVKSELKRSEFFLTNKRIQSKQHTTDSGVKALYRYEIEESKTKLEKLEARLDVAITELQKKEVKITELTRALNEPKKVNTRYRGPLVSKKP